MSPFLCQQWSRSLIGDCKECMDIFTMWAVPVTFPLRIRHSLRRNHFLWCIARGTARKSLCFKSYILDLLELFYFPHKQQLQKPSNSRSFLDFSHSLQHFCPSSPTLRDLLPSDDWKAFVCPSSSAFTLALQP